jgi:indole-3-glycerol phosphate synthase
MSTEAPSAASPPPLGAAQLAGIPGVLGRIVRERAADVAGERFDVPATTPRRLERALAGRAEGRTLPAVIAEIKRASPSLGAIADLDPVATARGYAAAGAAAISVLTEPHHFGGSLDHLRAVTVEVGIPVLRKDFIVHPRQLDEAVAAGAAAVLLMVSVLGGELPGYLAAAHALGLDALVEVHDEVELRGALDAGARIIGVNNRDLRSLEIDLTLAPRMIRAARPHHPEVVWVAESGYRDAAAIAALRGVADAVLIGSHFAAASDPGGALAALLQGAAAATGGGTE